MTATHRPPFPVPWVWTSKYGLKPKGDYDFRLPASIQSLSQLSKYGLKPKGDYDGIDCIKPGYVHTSPNTD